MARSRYCRVCQDFHDLTQAWPLECVGHFGVKANAAPFVHSDTMDAMVSMADGKMYDSKSRYRTELRAHGCYEVGNDSMERSTTSAPPVRDALRHTLRQLGG